MKPNSKVGIDCFPHEWGTGFDGKKTCNNCGYKPDKVNTPISSHNETKGETTPTISEIKKKFNNFLVKEEVIKKGSDWNERIYNLWNFFLPYLTAGKKEKTPFDNYSDKDIAESFEEERFGFK